MANSKGATVTIGCGARPIATSLLRPPLAGSAALLLLVLRDLRRSRCSCCRCPKDCTRSPMVGVRHLSKIRFSHVG